MMTWFQQNRWLGTFLIASGVATLFSLILFFWAKGSANSASDRFAEAITERNRLERLDPFPSAENFRKMKIHLENYKNGLEKLKEDLKPHAATPAPLAANEFQSRLRQAMVTVGDKARAGKVGLPENFALGFEEYTTALPGLTASPLLGRELTQIQTLVNILVDAHVESITKFVRTPLPEERSAPTPTPAAGGRKGPAVAPSGPKLVERAVVDLEFVSTQTAARKVLNSIAASNEQFFITRTVHVLNEKEKGPPREKPTPARPGATPAPTPVTSKTPSNTALTFIVGNEKVQTSARVELVRFTF